ncbi:MAG: VWA domain-containing protein, partial [Fibrobacter sp.]|nr:VWA domain-containing protein [Fibrobacter sp.]
LLAFAAIKNNDKVGLLIYTDQVELFIPPEKGRKHVLRLIREILYFKPQHHGTNTQVALEYAGKILNRHAVVVVMSDFLDQGFENAFKILRKRHDVLAVSVVDPRETELPPAGLVELEDPETGETLLIDTGDATFREAFAREAKRQGKATKELFQRMSIDFVRIETHDDFKETVAPLIEHFRRRAKMARI